MDHLPLFLHKDHQSLILFHQRKPVIERLTRRYPECLKKKKKKNSNLSLPSATRDMRFTSF